MNPWEQLVISAFVAILAAYFSAHFALRKYTSQKWWDKKLEAYTAIFEAWYQTLEIYRVMAKHQEEGHTPNEDPFNKMSEAANIAFRTISKYVSIGPFLLSSDAHNLLVRLHKDIMASMPSGYPHTIDASILPQIASGMDEFRQAALKDLQKQPSDWDSLSYRES